MRESGMHWGGIASAGDGLAAKAAARSPLSSTALVSSSTNKGTPSARATISSTVSRARPALPASLSTGAAPSCPPSRLKRQARHMRLAAPGMLELGAEGDNDQDGQA
jgi:hypothetical protein